MAKTQGAHAHSAAHGILHSAAESDALLQLLSDVLGNQLSVGVNALTTVGNGKGSGGRDT